MITRLYYYNISQLLISVDVVIIIFPSPYKRGRGNYSGAVH